MLLNIVSRSGGGRLERDHAAAIFYKEELGKSSVDNALGWDAYPDDARELVDVSLFGLDEVGERVCFFWSCICGRTGGCGRC